MTRIRGRRWYWLILLAPVAALPMADGCQALSNRLTQWNMLGDDALADPIQAVGGDGVVFDPGMDDKSLDRRQLAAAADAALVDYYAPIFVQQRVDTAAQKHPYPPEYDQIGEGKLRREGAKLKAFVAGPPKVYAICQKVPIEGRQHVQLTYTAWYPAHPAMTAFDLEEADIDSCVVRLTLDADNAPLFYETIAACGCFHKVFIEHWVEEAAAKAYGPPIPGKRFTVEMKVKDKIEWEVAGVVDDPQDRPRRPVVFIKAGDHKVIGVGSAARLKVPAKADVRKYALVGYDELYAVTVEGGGEKAPFFNLGKGGKVWGAERKERFLFSLVGVDAAGQPRANDQIKLHFDQSTWGDPTIYGKFLRLPPGVL